MRHHNISERNGKTAGEQNGGTHANGHAHPHDAIEPVNLDAATLILRLVHGKHAASRSREALGKLPVVG